MATVLAGATSNPGFLELEVWFNGSFMRAVEARASSASRKATSRRADPVRKPADIELRRPASLNTYRYQLHGRT